MKIFKTIVCVLFGLMFVNAGLDKLLHYMPVPDLGEDMKKIYEAFTALKWLMPLVAVVELIGGILFIAPKTRALGAIVILPVLVGIIIQNAVFAPSGLLICGLLFAIEIWVIASNWDKYKAMF